MLRWIGHWIVRGESPFFREGTNSGRALCDRIDLVNYGMMHRFQNMELSDWVFARRGLKTLNGMTWVLPPKYRCVFSGPEQRDWSRMAT